MTKKSFKASEHNTEAKNKSTITEQPGTKAGFAQIGSLFDGYRLEDKGGYISKEFQDFGYRMAVELSDPVHKSLYMKLAKTVDRLLLEKALSFVKDAPNVKSKAKLFMWRLKQLRAEKLDSHQSKNSAGQPDK
ncbi:MAG: hypothetical protein COY81_01880 [Candidatus Pacebacteria bacterium CG_4_10_14_0_8_um_filter_43_12]|nr:MAG: hypothetical protein COU66_01175 [Candidatus Pacebacteria bacterium CG10_big_fil_rev_8_21_14_0_10_44_11]PIY79602.1 MAG: hypothetical protein COY81_01880 [Candidatus Pacebacteria bacterium CG_4_10_14_0_8_um_filter_43_12]